MGYFDKLFGGGKKGVSRNCGNKRASIMPRLKYSR